jgi:hypothetical protein
VAFAWLPYWLFNSYGKEREQNRRVEPPKNTARAQGKRNLY